MLPQFGLTEFMLVAIVALIVVGPKDLPLMMRKLGQFVAKGRAMAREFQSAFDDIARQAELDELRKEIQDLRRDNALTEAVDELKKTESDINRRVMMENPWPQAGKEGGCKAESLEGREEGLEGNEGLEGREGKEGATCKIRCTMNHVRGFAQEEQQWSRQTMATAKQPQRTSAPWSMPANPSPHTPHTPQVLDS